MTWHFTSPPRATSFPLVEDCGKPPEELGSGFDPAKCNDWLAKTRALHAGLAQLMVRRYHITDQGVQEVSATPAWHRLKATLPVPPHLKRHPLAPGALPEFRTDGRTFEAEIPWEAMPPMEHTPLTSFRWAWNWIDAQPAPPPAWRTAVLMQPRRYRFTACDYHLSAYPGAEVDPVWYQPGSQLLLHDVVSFRYPFQFFWEPAALSPAVEVATAFEDRLEPSVWFCGPFPAQNWRGQHSIGDSGEFSLAWWYGGFPSPGKYRKQRLPPHAAAYGFGGGGQCGACTVWSSSVWRVRPSGIEQVYEFTSGRIGDGDPEATLDWDIHYGPDLRYVDVYTETAAARQPGELPKSAGWARTRFCYANGPYGNGLYRACGPVLRQAPARRVARPETPDH